MEDLDFVLIVEEGHSSPYLFLLLVKVVEVAVDVGHLYLRKDVSQACCCSALVPVPCPFHR